MKQNKTKPEQFFHWVSNRSKTILIIGTLFILAMGFYIPKLEFDTGQEAFIDKDNSVLVYRDKVKETFGLKDPMVIAVHNENGVFNPQSLRLISSLSDSLIHISGIDPDKIMSIATEKNIKGTYDGLEVDYFYDPLDVDQASASNAWKAVQSFDLYYGSIVSKDGKTALIVAEYFEEEGVNALGNRIYEDILDLAEQIEKGDNEVHVAGIGAVSDYLTTYIDKDAKKLNPFAGLVITIILILAYRTVRGALIPNLVVLATAAGSLGIMALFNVPFYVITNALPVVLIAIAVADAIHILGQYYEEAREHPQSDQQTLVIKTMVAMWRPVTVTSITTIAGFIAISLSSDMPPFKAFGLFAAIGVAIAFAFSIFFIPAALMLLKPQLSRAMGTNNKEDRSSLLMEKAGSFVIRKPVLILLSASILIVAAFVAALQLKVDYAAIDNFQKDEAIVQADAVINAQTNGTTYLDIVIETPETEDLFEVSNLLKIQDLQSFVETLPNVQGSTSIVDFIKKINQSLNEDDPGQYKIPESKDLIAQEFLLYTSSGDPTDFDNYVDYDYRLANVRVSINNPWYSNSQLVHDYVKEYINNHFNDESISATLSGSASLDVEWIGKLGPSHFIGMIIALAVVLSIAALSFRSFWAGALTSLPVLISILFIYAVMGIGTIYLEVGTTMFAAIAIGVGVDFAVHTVDRLIYFIKDLHMPAKTAYQAFYKSTGRALLFNLLALALGFGVLLTSSVPPLQTFGALVGLAVTMSFLGSMTLLPAIIWVAKPGFLFGSRSKSKSRSIDDFNKSHKKSA